MGDAYNAGGVNLRDPTNSDVYLTAGVWGNPASKIPGFAPVPVHSLQRGDILSEGEHVAIYDPGPHNEPQTISAAYLGYGNRVVHNDWGFRGNEKPITAWRYVGYPPPNMSRSPR